MFDNDPGKTVELVSVVVRIGASVLIANSLLCLLAFRLFPKFANRIRKKVAMLFLEMADSRPKGSRIAAVLFRISKWFEVEQDELNLATDSSRKLGAPGIPAIHRLASNRAYETWVTPNAEDVSPVGAWIIRNPLNGNGIRVLRKEKKVLAMLRRAASRTEFSGFFPLEVPFPDAIEIAGVNLQPLYRRRTRHSRTRDFGTGHGSCWIAPRDSTTVAVLRSHRCFDEPTSIQLLASIFHALGFIHRLGTIHGAISPQHLIVDPSLESLMLVDWTHAKRIGKRFGYLPRTWHSWYPKEAKNSEPAVPASDIYMAIKTFLFLIGKDVRGDKVPQFLTPRTRGIVRACLLKSPRMRPGDAWELRDELEEILEDQWGSQISIPKL